MNGHSEYTRGDISECPFFKHTNGVMNGHANGHANGHTNGNPHINGNSSHDEDYTKHHGKLHNLKDRLTVEDVRGSEVTYANYINTNDLLALQGSDIKLGHHHHDEHLFILVHQEFELWFKQILHELTSVQTIFISSAVDGGKLSQQAAHVIVSRIDRCDRIMRHALGIFDILETMHPADFLEFRDYIGPASGFQSIQMREMEILLGLEDTERVRCGFSTYMHPIQKDVNGVQRIMIRKGEATIRNLVYDWLENIYNKVPSDFVQVFLEKKKENVIFQKSLWQSDPERVQQAVEKELNDLKPFMEGMEATNTLSGDSQPTSPSEEDLLMRERRRKRRIATLFVMCYRHDPAITLYANILDAVVGFEEAFVLWRTRHARMVERMIGRRLGTGGSSGVAYLDMTTQYRIFMDLWLSRSHFLRASALPKMHLLK
ncbi:tryptophan 2,3-dioxygenase [Acrasis kona]|uniref:Tryptophan 2,3-dioxygenase n=1 Tax=Acrasis kona TaxID=1008807 RepID=A0AAW2ZH73_9EUKA